MTEPRILDTQSITEVGLQPRAIGRVELQTKLHERTAIARLVQSGCLKLLFPQNNQHALEAVLLNTAGGITGGDNLNVDVEVAAYSTLTLTTQAAERAYRALDSQAGSMTTAIKVGSAARLNWLPQETILFDGCNLSRRLKIDLDEDAHALICEPLVFGRRAMNERLSDAVFKDRIELSYKGHPLLREATDLSGDVACHLQKPHIANGAGAVAFVAYFAPDAEGYLQRVRDLLPNSAGASLVRDRLLVARILAPDSFELRKSLLPVLTLLNQASLPRCWMI